VAMNHWLEPELQRGLREVAAPPELWDRIQGSKTVAPPQSNRLLVWAMAAAVAITAVGLSLIHRDNVAHAPLTSDHCQNPAQLRAWVRAKTGLDLPFRADASASIQLIEARSTGGRVEISYRAGNRDALLMLSRAEAGSSSVPHSRFTLSGADPAGLQLACKLCHLD
jgi:hypothetical protein